MAGREMVPAVEGQIFMYRFTGIKKDRLVQAVRYIISQTIPLIFWQYIFFHLLKPLTGKSRCLFFPVVAARS